MYLNRVDACSMLLFPAAASHDVELLLHVQDRFFVVAGATVCRV